MKKTQNYPLPGSRPHYHLLDGLRGVAAMMVLLYHLGEGFCTSPADLWLVNHGYLAVQLFFVLSGFVIGIAYDGRWGKMTLSEFVKRRVIRLQPMVVLGVVLGVISFFVQGSVTWGGEHVGIGRVLLAAAATMVMLPALPGSVIEIRGNAEMYPLDGPLWSLFFEYIGSFLYCCWIRKLSTRTLAILTVFWGLCVAGYAMGNVSGYYHLGVGWSFSGTIALGGLICLLFCFSAGLLMARLFVPGKIRVPGAFWICSVAIVVLLSMPYFDYAGQAWLNGLYETVCVLFVFPLIVWIGASGDTTDKLTTSLCDFSGRVSYPVYVLHYPSLYLFYAWVWNNGITWAHAWPVGLCIVAGNILLAYLALKVYDTPVRQWLASRFLHRP